MGRGTGRGVGNRQRKASDDQIEIAAAERRAKVLDLRAQGFGWREVGKKVGVSHEQARQDYERAVREIPAAAVEQHRADADGALRLVIRGHAARALKGSPESARVIVQAVKTHAAIFGYAAPKRIELSGTVAIDPGKMSDDELDRFIASGGRDGGARAATPSESAPPADGLHPVGEPAPGASDVDGADR
jgi:hypothetical protein